MEAIAAKAMGSYRTVEDMAVHAIREAIVSGIYQPGAKLTQDRLAQTLGVSRLPVRTSLRQLEAEGLIVFQPHRGAHVRQLTPEEVVEIYELRVLLETFALRSAVARIKEQDMDHLEALADEMDGEGNPDRWLELRHSFYTYLYELAERPRTAELIMKLHGHVGRYWLNQPKVVEEGRSTHRVIVESIRAGDLAGAEQCLGEHLTSVSKELQRRIQQQAECHPL